MNETYYVYCAGCTNVKGSFIPKQIHEPPYCGNCGKEVKMNETQKTAKTAQNDQVEGNITDPLLAGAALGAAIASTGGVNIEQAAQGLKNLSLLKTPLPALKDATSPRDKNKTIQEVGTDPLLFEVLNRRFNFTWDLACNEDNCLVKDGETVSGWSQPEFDSLIMPWYAHDGWQWLNPPFKDIKPWAMKCAEEARKGAKIVMLTPASVGSKWFADHVYPNAYVRILTGRVTFQGHSTPYPKDVMISIFDNFHKGFDIWDWRAET